MTDKEVQANAQLEKLLARSAEDLLEQLQTRAAAAVGLIVVSLTRNTFLRSLSQHCEALHDNGSTEVHQIICEVNGALNEAADRLAFLTKEGIK